MNEPSAELGGRDEALKALVRRFQDDPKAGVFAELGRGLLARGHASEALSVCEHGLQMHPTHLDGRLERASALLALGRPRVAYVELRRALSLVPSHPRAMRLLGQAFKDAGAPERAAELLRKRSDKLSYLTPSREIPRPSGLPGPAPSPELQGLKEPAGAMSSFPFSMDLGLNRPLPPQEQRAIQVTQVIRNRIESQDDAALTSGIHGPIVDTSHSSLQLDHGDESTRGITLQAPNPLFEIASSMLDDEDEPLFQEDLPFDVRPVQSDLSQDLSQDLTPLEGFASEAPSLASEPIPSASVSAPGASSGAAPASSPMPPAMRPVAALRLSGGVIEKRRETPSGLRVEEVPLTVLRLLLGAAALVLMLAYAVGLFLLLEPQLEPWMNPEAPAPSVQPLP